MTEALAVAREGMSSGEVPIGALLARGDGTIIARGFNELNRTQNKTAHAEMVTFARSAGKAPPEARDLILVSTLEPCVMCLGAAMEAAVDTVIYAFRAPADNGTERVEPPQSPESNMPRIVGGIMAHASRALFEQWITQPGNNPQQVKFVTQLLSLTGAA
jgi:tRNA(Arg) A34 adenosine deaminase TadA